MQQNRCATTDLKLLPYPHCSWGSRNESGRKDVHTRLKGSSQPHLIRCSDDQLYAVKFQGNPHGIRILVNELLGSWLAGAIGIPVPTTRAVELSSAFIQQSEIFFNSALGCKQIVEGVHLGSKWVMDPAAGRTYDYLPSTMFARVANLNAFAGALAFDLWTNNRGTPKPLFRKPSAASFFKVTFLNHDFCFGGVAWELDRAQKPQLYLHAPVYRNIRDWSSFEPYVLAIEKIRLDEILLLAEAIPTDWYDDFAELQQMVLKLFVRRRRVRHLLAECIVAHRECFPDWRRHSRRAPYHESTRSTCAAEVTA